MIMSDSKIKCFPIDVNGNWHNGEHVLHIIDVAQNFPSCICAIRNSPYDFKENKEFCKILTSENYEELAEDEKKEYKKQSEFIYRLKENPYETILKKILKKLHLYTSANFVLFQHNYYDKEKEKRFKFFSLYMHLNSILKAECSKNIKYFPNNQDSFIIPNTRFATAGTSEDNEVIYQLEYFMDADTSSKFFEDKELLLPGNEGYQVRGHVQLFSLHKNASCAEKKYKQNTVFEILEAPDDEKYPNIAKVSPYLLPCIISKDINILDLNIKWGILNIFDLGFIFNPRISYLVEKNYINENQRGNVNKLKLLRIEKINGVPYDKDIKLGCLVSGFDVPALEKFKTCFIDNSKLKYDNSEFYVDISECQFKEVYYDKKRMLMLKQDSTLKTYVENPKLYEAKFIKMADAGQKKPISCNEVYFDEQNCKYGTDKKTYFKYSNDLYICLDDKEKMPFVSPDDYFTFFSSDELKEVEEEQDVGKKKGKLRRIFDAKIGNGGRSYEEGAFEHSSEWNRNENCYKTLGYIQSLIKKKQLAIWDENFLKDSLPDEIKNCSKFTFFYKSQFESFLNKLHKSYADKLRKVQNIVINKYSFKQGNLGLYKSAFGFKSSDGQTFCNHAVFETIIKVDGNFNNFTGKSKKENPSRNPLMESFPECPNPNTYAYKPSNCWCDVLEYHASKSSETGIYKIKAENAEQAFYMARLGYVVIAAWKNLTPKGNDPNINYSPHFVTLRPCEGEYPGLGSLLVAHVGAGVNKELVLSKAFPRKGNKENKYKEVYFYCNIRQCFI